MKIKSTDIKFSNTVIDKHRLKQIIVWAFRNYGIARAANMVDKLKDLGFAYATKAGISLSVEDLRIPPVKTSLLKSTLMSIEDADYKHKRGEITAVERFQKVIDTWNNSSDLLKKEIIKYFKNADPLNSIYMMAFSGARGNISQVRQLVGMRGLMSDPQGQIIDLPISSNFREGLTITDYFISSYGARKGLVDTALRTADSGYLTRRLVDVAQDVIVREVNCKTNKGIILQAMIDNDKTLISLKQSLIGRVLAESIFDPISGNVIAFADQSVTPYLADKIVHAGYTQILVRSPITCNSIRSVCQLCYGWNLAHGSMVDLGEAVGIIAAQSIGEPGTQLTMRTFHTGGVFTGELAQRIISPVDGRVHYVSSMRFIETRTRHGDPALLLNEDCKLVLVDINNENHYLNLTKGSLLLVRDQELIKRGSILAEYPLSYRSMTERAQKILVSDFSGIVQLSNLSLDNLQDKNKQNSICIAGNYGILWVLSGLVHSIPDNFHVMVMPDQTIDENDLIAYTQLVSRYNGRVKLVYESYKKQLKQIYVLISCKIFSHIKIYLDYFDGSKNYILQTESGDRFILNVYPNYKINNDQILGNLISDVYKTNTGGIIKYLYLPVSRRKISTNNDYYDILGSGYILWIPEETHEINKDISLLLVKDGDFIEAGTEIIKNIFANNSGVLKIIQKDGIIREIVIKPGKIYTINDDNCDFSSGKSRGFLRPGQSIAKIIRTDKLVYWEYIKMESKSIILIRPVIVYSVPRKSLSSRYTDDSFGTDMFNIEIVRRTHFRDGSRIKSIYGVNLVTTHLVAKLKYEILNVYSYVDIIPSSIRSLFLLKLITADTLSYKDIQYKNNRNFYTKNNIQVKDNEYITKGTVVYKIEILSSIEGTVRSIQQDQSLNSRILITTSMDTVNFHLSKNQQIKVQADDWVYLGDEIASNTKTLHSGKVLNIRNNKITIQIGKPYLISKGSILHVEHMSLIKRGENIATLIFERAKTGDIVQGLPKIEEILEARKKADTSFNVHAILESYFKSCINYGLSLYDAARLSLLNIQLFLVREVQLVYQAQGVDISDKHIEVIVRQMTSWVKIEKGGDTGFLPGEMLELQKVESTNRSLLLINKNPASYYPVILGITKASLNTESFISAASFQETTKVLTEAAISGKLDWLRGLKENVIIGRLIPAGTGFNINTSPSLNRKDYRHLINTQQSLDILDNSKKSSFDDIILDDRIGTNEKEMIEEKTKLNNI